MKQIGFEGGDYEFFRKNVCSLEFGHPRPCSCCSMGRGPHLHLLRGFVARSSH